MYKPGETEDPVVARFRAELEARMDTALYKLELADTQLFREAFGCLELLYQFGPPRYLKEADEDGDGND